MAWHSFRAPVRARPGFAAMAFAVAIFRLYRANGRPARRTARQYNAASCSNAAPPLTEVQPPPAAVPGSVGSQPEAIATEGRAKVALLAPLSGANRRSARRC